MRLSAILRQAEGPRLFWWCPGCGEPHCVQVGDGPGPRWNWIGDAERPTFTPSVLVTGRDTRCHSFVREGSMVYLDDCTHDLAGKTVPIPEWPTDFEGV